MSTYSQTPKGKWLTTTFARRLVALLFVSAVIHAASANASTVRAGDRLPPVQLADWNGGSFDLAQLHGRAVVIDFWASWCATCQAALPALDAISRRHPELVVVAINIDKSQAPAARFLAERVPQPHMALLRDPDGATLARFGAAGLPALYVIDRDGVVQHVEAGYAVDRLPAVEAMLDNLLHPALAVTAGAGEPVPR